MYSIFMMLLRKFLFYAGIIITVLYLTPMGTMIRPMLTPKDKWFSGAQFTAYGSGFYINETDLLTSYHVVANCNHILVGGRDGRNAESKIIAYDATGDVAVLRSASRVGGILYLAKPEEAETEIKIAYPDYTSEPGVFTIDRGLVTLRDQNTIYSSIGLKLGNDGAPLLNSNGYVIGVNKGWHGSGIMGFFNFKGDLVSTGIAPVMKLLDTRRIAYQVYEGEPVNMLQQSTYTDYIAVNVGCMKDYNSPIS